MSSDIKEFIIKAGADLVGFADLTELQEDRRSGLASGIAVGIALNPKIVSDIPDGPTLKYADEYDNTNSKLDEISKIACKHGMKSSVYYYSYTGLSTGYGLPCKTFTA